MQLICILPFGIASLDVVCPLHMYIHICNSDVFSVVNIYLGNLKFCVVCVCCVY